MGVWAGGRVCGGGGGGNRSQWNFGPILDIDTNYHNPITNTRVFSSDQGNGPSRVQEFVRGQMEKRMACMLEGLAGRDRAGSGRDQHMLTTINDCTGQG